MEMKTSVYNPHFDEPVTQQPAVNTTTVVTSQPRTLQWSSGICDCTHDAKSCFLSALPCTSICYAGCMAQRMGENFFMGCCFAPCSYWPMRSVFREKHKIQGSLCRDFCLMCFCTKCVLCQLSREMDRYNYPPKC